MKTCCECKKILEVNEFNKSSSSKDGYQNWCRSCQKKKYSEYRLTHPKVINDKWKRYYGRNREKMIKRTRDYEKNIGKEETDMRRKTYNKNSKFKRYGISEERYIQMLEEQEQKCGMCSKLFDKSKPKSIHIDHSHDTGKVRGILCDGCNMFLGRIESKEYQNRLEWAQSYIRKTEK